MRKQKINLFYSILLITIAIACGKDDSHVVREGTITFELTNLDEIEGGRTNASSVSSVMVTIADENGDLVKEREQLESTSFGDGFITLPISLPEGNYSLTEFMVLDENNEVVYATPVEGSDLAYLVTAPLPIGFVILANQTTELAPEVVDVSASLPEQYGYNGFSFTVIETFDLLFTVMEFDALTGQYEPVASDFDISSNENPVTSKTFEAGTSTLKLRSDIETYSFEITTTNYTETLEYETSELVNYSIETEPLEILLGEETSCSLWPSGLGFSAPNIHGDIVCYLKCISTCESLGSICTTQGEIEYCMTDNDGDGIDTYLDCDDNDASIGEECSASGSNCDSCDPAEGYTCVTNPNGIDVCIFECPDNIQCDLVFGTSCTTGENGIEYCVFDADNDGIDSYLDCDDNDPAIGEECSDFSDPFEPNGEAATSSLLSFCDPIDFSIGEIDDLDFFQLDVSTDQQLEFLFANVPSNITITITVFDSSVSELAILNGAEGEDYTGTIAVPAGTYYLRISDASTNFNTQAISFSVKDDSCP